MTSRRRKGHFPVKIALPKDATSSVAQAGIETITYRGPGVVDAQTIAFQDLLKVDLFRNNSTNIFTEFFQHSSRSTQNKSLLFIRCIARFIDYLESHNRKISRTSDLTANDTLRFTIFIHENKQKHLYIRFFNRFLRTIGCTQQVLVPNPYSANEPAIKKSIDRLSLQRALTRAKLDAEVVRKRLSIFQELRGLGRDPRTERGGWASPENRIWFIENLCGLDVPPWNVLKRNPAISPSLHELARKPGAPFAARPTGEDAKGGVETADNGYLAHVRWFYPDPDDLVPFIALLLMRTPLNLMAIAEAQVHADWHSPFQFNMSQKSDEFVYVWLNKVRGRSSRFDEPKAVYAISPKTPRSFPYQVRIFLETLTYELRRELKRQIDALASDPQADTKELNRLRSMENDLFLYRSYKGINSLRRAMPSGNPPAFLTDGLKSYGITPSAMRGNNLGVAYNSSGQNLAAITFLAKHQDRSLAILYARRDSAVRKTEELFRNVFNHSLNLIKSKNFSVENLKLLLEAQHLDQEQILNLLDPETRTRWGNGCADPLRPPKGFDRGTLPGQFCREQNCIDGCPRARWFRDSSDLIDLRLRELHRRLGTSTLHTTAASTLLSKIDRLNVIAQAMRETSL